VKEQLRKDVDVAAKTKTSLQYGGVPRVLGMGLAPLAVVGIAELHSTQSKSAQLPIIMLLGPRKQATHHCRLLEATCSVVWAVYIGVFSYASCLTRAEQRRKHSLLVEWISVMGHIFLFP